MPLDERKDLGEFLIKEMTEGDGISIVPDFTMAGRGYHPETGADQITFGGYAHKAQHILTFVMPLEQAREACEKLAKKIALVDRLNAAKRQEEDNA